MNLTVSTPALLFPAIALLMLAYTNRYHFIVNLIRELIKSVKRKELAMKLQLTSAGCWRKE